LIVTSVLSHHHIADTIQASIVQTSLDLTSPGILGLGLRFWFLAQNFRNLKQAEPRSTYAYLGLVEIYTTDILSLPRLHPGGDAGISHKSSVACSVLSLVMNLASDL